MQKLAPPSSDLPPPAVSSRRLRAPTPPRPRRRIATSPRATRRSRKSRNCMTTRKPTKPSRPRNRCAPICWRRSRRSSPNPAARDLDRPSSISMPYPRATWALACSMACASIPNWATTARRPARTAATANMSIRSRTSSSRRRRCSSAGCARTRTGGARRSRTCRNRWAPPSRTRPSTPRRSRPTRRS